MACFLLEKQNIQCRRTQKDIQVSVLETSIHNSRDAVLCQLNTSGARWDFGLFMPFPGEVWTIGEEKNPKHYLNNKVKIYSKCHLWNSNMRNSVALCLAFVIETPIPVVSISRTLNQNTALVLSVKGEIHKK